MKTAVVGFPRIGKDRELKFATEKYFRNEISESDLNDVANTWKNFNITSQKEAGIDFISSNDFSFYDNVLDTAVLFNVVPKRYKALGLSNLDTYFSMARGYQGDKGNVKALAMKKWFNTNYHYIVPEIEDDTKIELVGTKLFDEYDGAKASGIETKPVVVGPFTFLKLARYTGEKKAEDFVDALTEEYIKLIKKLDDRLTHWLQIDEPYLVMDLSFEDKALFKRIYDKITAASGGVRLLLQTYFGDVRDIYDQLIQYDLRTTEIVCVTRTP